MGIHTSNIRPITALEVPQKKVYVNFFLFMFWCCGFVLFFFFQKCAWECESGAEDDGEKLGLTNGHSQKWQKINNFQLYLANVRGEEEGRRMSPLPHLKSFFG